MTVNTALKKSLAALGLLALLLCLCAFLLALYGTLSKSELQQRIPVPGVMVDVGGHSLHLNCRGQVQGQARHTVVLESGGGSWSLDWFMVSEGLSPYARVCSYDRAGFGWSEAAEGQRDFQTLVAELDTLLDVAGERGPYYFVGASLGAGLVQLYAQQHPEKVAGILLLDGRGRRSVTDLLAIEPSLLPPPLAIEIGQFLGSLNLIDGLLRLTGTESFLEPAHPNLRDYPEEIRQAFLDGALLAKNLRATLAEAAADSLSEAQMDRVANLGNIPLIVVRHGFENRFDALDLSAEMRADIEEEWIRQQLAITALSSEGRLVVAEESGHLIQLQQPTLVVDLVRDLLTMSRN